jgi:hypothetical protein
MARKKSKGGKGASVSAVVNGLMHQIAPGAMVAGAVGAGAVAAQVGGAAAKAASASVATFAARGDWEEAAVHAGAGIAVDAVGLAGMAMMKHGRAAMQLAPFVLGGTLLGAAAPVAAPHVANFVVKVVDFVESHLGIHAASPAPAAIAAAAKAPPGGVMHLLPGGIAYGASAMDLPGGTFTSGNGSPRDLF